MRTRSIRHAFKALQHDPGRCAYCLRSLDCAPHLPLTPRATYPEQFRARDIYTWPGTRRLALARLEETRRALAAVQGGR